MSVAPAGGPRRPSVLVLSRNYPNDVLPLLGIWVQRLVRQAATSCDVRVISPVPYCPPLPFIPENFKRFRSVRLRWNDGGVPVYHPRFLVSPGARYPAFEARSYYTAVKRPVLRLFRDRPFDLIHAHFTYPDGWVAGRLGRRLNLPVIITEQAMWGPWMDRDSAMRRGALWAARACTFHIAISTALRHSIVRHTGETPRLRVIPDGVDGALFTLPEPGTTRLPDQVLFVGNIRHVKGVDVLLRAMRVLAESGSTARLLIVGSPHYESYRREHQRMQALAGDLGLSGRVSFLGAQSDQAVVRLMQTSALLVLSSRRESLGMVLAEALACGTPVVSTRCGGPEDIVTPEVGELVPPENPEALAQGIARVMERRASYDPAQLRAYAMGKFGLETVHARIAALYDDALAARRRHVAHPSSATTSAFPE